MKIIKNEKGNAILTAFLIMSGMMVVVFSVSDNIIKSLVSNRTRNDSLKAYFIGEAGIEKLFYYYNYKKEQLDLASCEDDKIYIDFDNGGCVEDKTQAEEEFSKGKYIVEYVWEDSIENNDGSLNVRIRSFGMYKNTVRIPRYDLKRN